MGSRLRAAPWTPVELEVLSPAIVLRILGLDPRSVWNAPSTTERDRNGAPHVTLAGWCV